MTLEEEVLARERPTDAQRAQLQATVERLTEAVEGRMRELEVQGRPLLVGSAAKDTYLWPAEIDLFVALPPATPRDELRRIGLDLGTVLEDREVRYAEHPYTRGTFDGLEAEVVPCYDLREASEKMSAVDRTPFHAAYVVEHLEAPGRDEVRLLKRFMKGVGVYGAEAKVEGFSGYMVELLVLAYGSLRGVLEAASEWQPGAVVPLTEAPAAFEAPLVLVDPVDATRNAASAVSVGALGRFIHAAGEYLREPREAFFYPKEKPILAAAEAKARVAERETAIVGIMFEEPDVVDDILYPQLRKAERAIAELLKGHDFRVVRSVVRSLGPRDAILFELQAGTLPAVRVHRGPPVGSKHVDDFLKKWREHPRTLKPPHVHGHRWVVDLRREYPKASELLEAELARLSLGKDIGPMVERGVEVVSGEAVFEEDLLPAVTDLLDHRFPWER